jgi:hypothetical protein
VTQLKPLHQDAIPRAFDKAERYRLLNEPFEAESICLDILAVEPEHPQALGCLLFALTDQFNHGGGQAMERARALLSRFPREYERAYYAGIISERFAKRKLREAHPGARALAYGHLREAMGAYETAERHAPSGNDDAVLRFNACVRLIERQALTAPQFEEREPLLE